MQHDSSEIQNLLSDEQEIAPLRYTQEDRRYIPAISSVYTGGIVEFDTLNLQSDYRVLSNQYFECDLQVVSSGAAYVGNEKICLKNSVVSCIRDTLIRWNNTTVVQDSGGISKVNKLRHMLTESKQHLESQVSETGFYPDEAYDVGVLDNTNALTQQAVALNNMTGLPTDPTHNKGALERERAVTKSFAGGVWTFHVRINLAEVSPVYTLAEPITNIREIMRFTFDDASKMFLIDPVPDGGGAATKSTPISAPGGLILTNSARLYYTSVKLDAESASMYYERVKTGSYKRRKRYLGHKQFVYPSNGGIIGAGNVSFPITSSINKPKRISLWLTPQIGGVNQDTSSYYSEAPTASCTNLNVYLDNDPFLEQSTSTVDDQYHYIQKQLASSPDDVRTSSIWSRRLYSTHFRVPCFDVSRSEKSERAVAIRADFVKDDAVHNGLVQIPAATQTKLEAIVEFEAEVEVDLVTGEVKSTHQ